MGVQTRSEIDAELQEWYKARKRAALGKSTTIQTSAGMRTVTSHNLADINDHINRLERALQAPKKRGGAHNFAVANFNNTID